jgi:cell division protease FtsH
LIKELCLGASIAVLIFLILMGQNIIPILLLAGLGFFLFMLMDKKGLVTSSQFTGYSSQVDFTFDDIGGAGSRETGTEGGPGICASCG